MTDQQERHLQRILKSANNRITYKYSKGALEYGTNLNEMGAGFLIEAAIDEAVDQLTYLLTLKEVLEQNQPGHVGPNGELE